MFGFFAEQDWADVSTDSMQDSPLDPGQVYMADRFGYLPDVDNTEFYLRTCSDAEVLEAIDNGRIPKEKVPVVLREIGDNSDPDNSEIGNFKIAIPAKIPKESRRFGFLLLP